MLTSKEMEERKERYWGAARNEMRRKKYAENAAFREAEKIRMRVFSKEQRDVYDPRSRLSEMPKLAVSRPVYAPGGAAMQMEVFTTEELADLLRRKTQALYRWRAAGKFPEGRYKMRAPTGNLKQVYTLAEAEAIIKVFGAHLMETPYYHEKHTETRRRLFEAVEAVRQ